MTLKKLEEPEKNNNKLEKQQQESAETGSQATAGKSDFVWLIQMNKTNIKGKMMQ